MGNKFHTKIAGVTNVDPISGLNRQDIIAKRLHPGQKLQLIPEPDNPVDSGAVAVHATLSGQTYHLGYLNRKRSQQIKTFIDAGQPVTAIVKEITGGSAEKPTYGVNITITTPKEKSSCAKIIIIAIIAIILTCLILSACGLILDLTGLAS